jgi:hypothetical protein
MVGTKPTRTSQRTACYVPFSQHAAPWSNHNPTARFWRPVNACYVVVETTVIVQTAETQRAATANPRRDRHKMVNRIAGLRWWEWQTIVTPVTRYHAATKRAARVC